MIFPQNVDVRRKGGTEEESKFWFAADPALLAAASAIVDKVELQNCSAEGECLPTPPRIVVGGNGVSGQAFVDNAKFRSSRPLPSRRRCSTWKRLRLPTVAYAMRPTRLSDSSGLRTSRARTGRA
jgi:hypothetical protein